jgi:hypothetical protein
MTWLLVGGTACAVFVVLAGIWIGRTMRDLDRSTEPRAPATSLQPPALPSPRRPEPGRCACGVEDWVVGQAHVRAAPQPSGTDRA